MVTLNRSYGLITVTSVTFLFYPGGIIQKQIWTQTARLSFFPTDQTELAALSVMTLLWALIIIDILKNETLEIRELWQFHGDPIEFFKAYMGNAGKPQIILH
jgi:hypothetical protein